MSKANANTAAEANNTASAINLNILKTGNCPSLSGKSTLVYHMGKDSDGGIQLRLVSNSGSGFFSNEWVPLQMIQQACQLESANGITSYSLHRIFKGKSLNNGGFLLAVLLQEKLVTPMVGKARRYQLGDLANFNATMQLLVAVRSQDAKGEREVNDAASDINADVTPVPAKKSAKKPAAELATAEFAVATA